MAGAAILPPATPWWLRSGGPGLFSPAITPTLNRFGDPTRSDSRREVF